MTGAWTHLQVGSRIGREDVRIGADGYLRDLASRLTPQDRARSAALLIVRYCGFHADPRFNPWFPQAQAQAQAALREAVEAAEDFATGTRDLDSAVGLKATLSGALEAVDPDGPPFETEISDALILGIEVCDLIQSPGSWSYFDNAYGHASELAEAHAEMGEEFAGDGGDPLTLMRR